jgi:hypothetical protein
MSCALIILSLPLHFFLPSSIIIFLLSSAKFVSSLRRLPLYLVLCRVVPLRVELPAGVLDFVRRNKVESIEYCHYPALSSASRVRQLSSIGT